MGEAWVGWGGVCVCVGACVGVSACAFVCGGVVGGIEDDGAKRRGVGQVGKKEAG